ncbi:MAG: hypothetical protein NXI24_24780 [bacterium]|nr:hypothetical protein [bacterium]
MPSHEAILLEIQNQILDCNNAAALELLYDEICAVIRDGACLRMFMDNEYYDPEDRDFGAMFTNDLVKIRRNAAGAWDLHLLHEHYGFDGRSMTIARVSLRDEAEETAWARILPLLIQINTKERFKRGYGAGKDPLLYQEGPFFTQVSRVYRKAVQDYWISAYGADRIDDF